MAFTEILDPRNSDVILEEAVNLFSRNKGDDTLTTSVATSPVKQGTVVWRAKSADPTAVWDIVDASGDISVNNEYAVLLGAQETGKVFRPNERFTVASATATKVILIKRAARVKEQVLKDVHMTGYGLNQTQFNQLKHLMSFQGILVEDSLTPVA